MNSELGRQLGDRPVALDRRSATLTFNLFFRVRFISCSCAIDAF
jgi:hypothetical protein